MQSHGSNMSNRNTSNMCASAPQCSTIIVALSLTRDWAEIHNLLTERNHAEALQFQPFNELRMELKLTSDQERSEAEASGFSSFDRHVV